MLLDGRGVPAGDVDSMAITILLSVAVGAGVGFVIIAAVEIRRRSARKHRDPICPHCGGYCVLVPLMVNEDPALDTVMCDQCLMTMRRGHTTSV